MPRLVIELVVSIVPVTLQWVISIEVMMFCIQEYIVHDSPCQHIWTFMAEYIEGSFYMNSCYNYPCCLLFEALCTIFKWY